MRAHVGGRKREGSEIKGETILAKGKKKEREKKNIATSISAGQRGWIGGSLGQNFMISLLLLLKF